MKVLVTFRNSRDKLTNMFNEKFTSVNAAKKAIIEDAQFFTLAHKYHGGAVGMKFRQKTGWVNPGVEDYYEVKGQDGSKCIWQYFIVER